MTAKAAATVRRELRLSHKVEGDDFFSVGYNCDAIERVDGGYEVHVGSKLLRVESAHVASYVQDPRPGYAQEQRDAAVTDVPSYATKLADGTWQCACGETKRTLHAVRVHHGRAHGSER